MYLQILFLFLKVTATLHWTSASPIPQNELISRDATQASDDMNAVGQVLDAIAPAAEAAGPEAEVAVDVASFAVDLMGKIFGAIGAAQKEDAANRSGGAYTQSVVTGTLKAHPGWNVIVVHPSHTTNFQGVQDKDWSHQHHEVDVKIGGTIGYEIYTARAGEFQLNGDGGYENWAYGGNIQANGDQNHHLILSGPPPKKRAVSGQCGTHITQYQKNEQKANPVDHYTVDIILKDAAGTVVGFNGENDDASKPVSVSSQLPNVFIVTAGSVDSDPLSFSYGSDSWKSDDKSRCSVGGYDSGSRQMDCSFACKF